MSEEVCGRMRRIISTLMIELNEVTVGTHTVEY